MGVGQREQQDGGAGLRGPVGVALGGGHCRRVGRDVALDGFLLDGLSVEVHQPQGEPHALDVVQAVGAHPEVEAFALVDGAENHVGIASAGLVVEGFPVAIVVDARPRHHGPSVVHLPIECPHAVGAVAAVGFHAAPDAVGLQHAAHVYKVLKLGRHAIVPAHGLLDERIADGGLLVGRHHTGFERVVAGLGKGADGLHLWKRLEAILAHEAWYLLVERLEAFLAVPCAPVVAVAHAPALGSSPVGLQW